MQASLLDQLCLGRLGSTMTECRLIPLPNNENFFASPFTLARALLIIESCPQTSVSRIFPKILGLWNCEDTQGCAGSCCC